MMRVDLIVPTPLGDASLELSPEGVRALRFDGTALTSGTTGAHSAQSDSRSLRNEACSALADPAAAALAARVLGSLDAYFEGHISALGHLPVDTLGTPFQQRVWAALRDIPTGQTRSYGELARELGSSARAVGRANALNPVALIVPCHRVIGANGSLTGYAYGLERKAWLLAHEAQAQTAAREPNSLAVEDQPGA